MFGTGMKEQKKLIPFVIDNQLPVFMSSVDSIFDEANVSLGKRNAVESASFFFWSMRLGVINAEEKMVDKYACDAVQEVWIKRWIEMMVKASGQKVRSSATRDLYNHIKKTYSDYDKTIQSGLFRRAENGRIDMPITEHTINLFISRVATDAESADSLSHFWEHFSVSLSEGQWAAAGMMKPRIVEAV